MATNKIYGKRGYKSQEHAIDNQCGRPWIKSDDEGEPREKLEERHDDGNQVDEPIPKIQIRFGGSNGGAGFKCVLSKFQYGHITNGFTGV